jgi:hypothetical protein
MPDRVLSRVTDNTSAPRDALLRQVYMPDLSCTKNLKIKEGPKITF